MIPRLYPEEVYPPCNTWTNLKIVPDQCTVEEAIRSHTIDGAWQDHQEEIKGSIELDKKWL
jgi:hypothetical protein